MSIHVPIARRTFIRSALAAPAVLTLGLGAARAATVLKLSHQFPGGTIDQGDFRDRMCRRFGQELERRTNGAVTVQVYPGSSLMKTQAQFGAMRKAALDMSLWPLAYASGEVAETSIGLMPALVSSYEQAATWKTAPIGKRLTALMAEKGLIFVSWVWQSGNAASRSRPLFVPGDAKGLKIRGGSREVDLLMKAAGAATLNLPSNEVYIAMQTGACDATVTSSTSMISFHVEELARHLTSGRGRFYWFMLEPIMMSKTVFDGLPKDQQEAILAVGAEMEPFGLKGAIADDVEVETIFTKAGAKVQPLDEDGLRQWRDLARDTVWKEFANRSSTCAELLKLAEAAA
ncbi:TRAP transporter substrate-binding protein DctP [Methylobacterium trifolii]|uniref:Solute-binding protein n=1 Tax=Methylobacterium trifolii TaxID=1003092 RepID=A0ABQ4U5V1_9HYPH|nr:TRAP transporter substrate-binding protein DctP [Methylobacterium trifolii]GJE61515.1 Solute-binding protein [Methylobacterium trifolii]